jgi:hypothetical protein
MQQKRLTRCGGGTDAGKFAKDGIKSTSFIGISTDLIRDEFYYHTAYDIVKTLIRLLLKRQLILP